MKLININIGDIRNDIMLRDTKKYGIARRFARTLPIEVYTNIRPTHDVILFNVAINFTRFIYPNQFNTNTKNVHKSVHILDFLSGIISRFTFFGIFKKLW